MTAETKAERSYSFNKENEKAPAVKPGLSKYIG
jgi:hypothetical protein